MEHPTRASSCESNHASSRPRGHGRWPVEICRVPLPHVAQESLHRCVCGVEGQRPECETLDTKFSHPLQTEKIGEKRPVLGPVRILRPSCVTSEKLGWILVQRGCLSIWRITESRITARRGISKSSHKNGMAAGRDRCEDQLNNPASRSSLRQS